MSRILRRVCVFCGSSTGADPLYGCSVRALGEVFAENGLSLVYGGGNVGLMGELARSVLQRDVEVVGVIPKHIHEAVESLPLSELHVVENMHERKAMIIDLVDAFITMPGGLGTIEEFFEAITWAQLGFHLKPCGLLNVANYFEPVLNLLDHMVVEEFMQRAHRDMIVVDADPVALLNKFDAYSPPRADKVKWVMRNWDAET